MILTHQNYPTFHPSVKLSMPWIPHSPTNLSLYFFFSFSQVIKGLYLSFIDSVSTEVIISEEDMSATQLQVESCVFPSTVKAPGSSKNFFLGGAGVRGLEIEGKFIKFTAIGVYLEDDAVPVLAVKWKGKSAEELTASDDFFKDLVMGPFEKFTQVTMILPLTGQQYSEAVVGNCVAYWKAVGTYSDAESEATKKFLDVFKDETFPPGASILFTQSHGSLKISFSKDGSLPEKENAVIENKQLSEAVLESIIGKNGVSPAAKQSLGVRLSDLLKLSTP